MSSFFLGIETSCDDTSVALVDRTGWVHNVRQASQDAVHAPFGGVVPEIASRNHTDKILPLLESLLSDVKVSKDQVEGIAVTNRPGLMGSLMVGASVAKALGQAWHKPVYGVNHLEGHILAPFLNDEKYQPGFHWNEGPFLSLAVSGGHTSIYEIQGLGKYKILGSTLDDAAGEAFDKFAKMVGLGFPGGAAVDRWAQQGNPDAFSLPRPMTNEDSLQMSFSGLKSSAARLLDSFSEKEKQEKRADLCASFQEAVVDILVSKMDLAYQKNRTSAVTLTGGVSANSRLRKKIETWAQKKKLKLAIPPLRFCTDNAAMIAYVGALLVNRQKSDDLNLKCYPHSLDGDFQ